MACHRKLLCAIILPLWFSSMLWTSWIISDSMWLKPILFRNESRCRITDLPCLAKKMSVMTPAAKDPVVTLVILDETYIEMFLNFAVSAFNNGVENLLPVGLSQKTVKELASRGFSAYYDASLRELASVEHRSGTDAFKKKGNRKFSITLKLLSLGYSVLLMDLDTVFIKNPFPYFQCQECDVEIQQDLRKSRKPPNLCIGVVFLRKTATTISIVNDTIKILNKNHGFWDQEIFTHQLATWQAENRLRYKVLPYNLFPTGDTVLTESIYKYNISQAVIFHNNLNVWSQIKKYRFKELGGWFLDTDHYYSSTSRKYLTYNYTFPIDLGGSTVDLNKALRLATTLNRILILPKFHCKPWKVMMECPLDRFMELEDFIKWDTINENKYREHTFLRNQKVPESVKQSTTKPVFVLTGNTTKLFPSKNFLVFRPNNITAGPTAGELTKWLKKYDHIYVIQLHSMRFDLQFIDI